jgi:tetratricopeptide (TPR) repeat protein
MRPNAATPLTSSRQTTSGESSVFPVDLSESSFRKALVFLTLLGLVIRIGFFMEHAHTPSFGVPTLDQKYYDTVAKMLLNGEDLHELHGFRPLLYPMFLAGLYKLGGSWGVDLAIFVQHLLGIGTGLIVALLGARLFRHRLSGVVGGVLYLLAPVPLYFEGELLIEPSYIFLICLGLLLHLQAAAAGEKKAILLWMLCGGMVVLASQARANILVFIGVYPLFAAWRWWRSRKPEALLPLLGLLGAFAMAIPWGVINMRQSDHFHLLPNAGGVNLYLGNKRTADGMVPEQGRRITSDQRYNDSVEVWAREEYETAMRAQGRQPETDPMAISRYWTHRTIDEIRLDPARWVRLIAKKCWLTVWNAEIPNNKAFAFLQTEYTWLRLLPVRWVVLLMFAPAGIWIGVRQKNTDALFILLTYAALYSAANVAFFICDRYRYPVWPVMAVFAGGGALALFQSVRERKLQPALWIAASMVLMSVISLPNWAGAKLPSFARDYTFRSIAWYEKGHFTEALNDIDRSIELDPADATTALHHRGNILFALNRFDEARVAYEQTLKLSPGEPGVWNNLGASLEALGRTDDALRAFRRATECTPPSRNAFLNIAFIQVRLNQLDDAASTLDQLGKLESTPNAASLALRSVIERRRGNTAHADELESKARTVDANTAAWAIERVTKGL